MPASLLDQIRDVLAETAAVFFSFFHLFALVLTMTIYFETRRVFVPVSDLVACSPWR